MNRRIPSWGQYWLTRGNILNVHGSIPSNGLSTKDTWWRTNKEDEVKRGLPYSVGIGIYIYIWMLDGGCIYVYADR